VVKFPLGLALTHQIVKAQKLELHPMKTYIGKISHGFNFLGYYFDNNKLLPSQESIRRLKERAFALYEHPPTTTRRHKRAAARGRDISEYLADEEQPNDEYFKNLSITLRTMITHQPDKEKRLQRYLAQWVHWTFLGLSTIKGFLADVETHLPSLLHVRGIGAMESHGLID